MIKVNVIKMLHKLHHEGVEVKANPEWSREEWVNYVINLFNIHCMPRPYSTAVETAEICCTNRRNGDWKRPFAPGQAKQTKYKSTVHRIR